MKRTIIFVLAVAALLVAVVPAFAQATTRSITVTEAQINSRYRVTNPPRQQVTNKNVNLQPGQAVLSATFTPRGGNALALTATVVPSIQNGRIYWTLTAATANGQAANADQLALINTHMMASWRNLIRQEAPTGRVQSITVTENDITVTTASR